ncbi:hypothetical protein ACO3TA_00035 [Methanocaldococcus sp. 28A]
MKKLLLAILGITLMGVVFAFPPWMNMQTTENIDINPEDILKTANIVNYTTPFGYNISHLEIDGQIVGVLWKDVDLSKLEIGEPFNTPFGEKYPLYYDGELVGFVFTNYPSYYYGHGMMRRYGYHNCPCGCYCGCCGQ